MRKYRKYIYLIPIAFLFFTMSCVPLEPTGSSSGASSIQSPLVLADRVYKPTIHSVQFYPNTKEPNASIAPAVTSIKQVTPLLLTFDELLPDFQQYSVRLIHCNWKWEESGISSLQYLNGYNDFPITEYDFSQNTRIPYVHYSFVVPRVKLAGNYVLVVFQNNDPSDIILSRRFMVYDTEARINYAQTLPAGPAERRENQQINLTLQYGAVPNVLDPGSQIKVVIRQNQRWDNAIFGLKPTGIREGLQEMEYQPFDLSNQFKGGSEFRFFDLRMVQARGQNVDKVVRDSKGVDAFLVVNKPFTGLAYNSIQDLNGQFILTNVEFPEPSISSEYVDVHFFLKTETPLADPVYVAGAFSNYLAIPPYLMRYDQEAGGYMTDILLKQGWYNYLFLLKNPEKPYAIEGSFAETENFYDIIVYLKPPGEIYDKIIGYTAFSTGR